MSAGQEGLLKARLRCTIACLQATRAYLHKEEAVEAALREAGWKVSKREMTSTRFYYSRLLQAAPASSA